MHKFSILIFLNLFIPVLADAQHTGSLTVGGDLDKFYPVLWSDGGWYSSMTTELEIGRSDIHTNNVWQGSTIAKFSYHVTNWGHRSAFINASIKTGGGDFNGGFVAGWTDGSRNNSSLSIIVWLRGSSTYFYKSNYPVSHVVYDGVQNPLPFQELNGPSHSFKTAVDSYVNTDGISNEGSAFFLGAGTNYFQGNVGIGTLTPSEQLSVNGKIRAKEIKVEALNWPDYVFKKDHELLPLNELEMFVKKNNHLPEIPDAKEAEENGISLGEMNAKLLKKIEELTLYMIELKKENEKQQEEINQLKDR